MICRKVKTFTQGYADQTYEDEFVIGKVVSEMEYYRELKEECFETGKIGGGKFKNRAEYWESFMTEEQLEERRRKLKLIAADGRDTYIYAYGMDDLFQQSDDFRYTIFEIQL